MINIKSFNEDDEEGLALSVDLSQLSFVTHPKDVFIVSKMDSWKDLNVRQYLLYDDIKVVGSFALSIDPDNLVDCSLVNFLIDKSQQGKGYGSQSIKAIIEFVKENEPGKDLTLKVVPENIVAKGLYEKNGFKYQGIDSKFNPPRFNYKLQLQTPLFEAVIFKPKKDIFKPLKGVIKHGKSN